MTSTLTTSTTHTRDEEQVRQRIADQTRAICAKNLDQIMAAYANDAVLFDMKPPLQLQGADVIHQMWATCLPCMPDATDTEIQDLSITVSGDLALAHWLLRFTHIEPAHPAAAMWLRITAGYRKHQGQWQTVHEHCSVPFNPAQC